MRKMDTASADGIQKRMEVEQSYKPGDAISSPKSNIVLYAQWNANVTLDNVVLGKFVNIGNGVQIN